MTLFGNRFGLHYDEHEHLRAARESDAPEGLSRIDPKVPGAPLQVPVETTWGAQWR